MNLRRHACFCAGLLLLGLTALQAQTEPAVRVLFVGNSYLFGGGSAVRFFHPEQVQDLHGHGAGGVPALFKKFTQQAGLRYDVSHATIGGADLRQHFALSRELIDRPWDQVVLQSLSTLDRQHPGDPTSLLAAIPALTALLFAQNPDVDIRLLATWSRADQTYLESGHWHGQTITAMATDIRAAYDRAAASTTRIRSVIPVGEAWNRAFAACVADPNPYDGLAAGQIDLWTYDHHHASAFGYYLEALVIFGDLTELDPRSLGKVERSAFELGFSPSQAEALQDVAAAELLASGRHSSLRAFMPDSSR